MENQTMAIHLKDNENHVVYIGALRVLVWEEDGSWNAQGVEIDYASCGESFDEACENFEKGFIGTIDLYLEKTGNIERFLRNAPMDVIKHILSKHRADNYEIVATLTREIPESVTPYNKIDFLPIRQAA